MSRAALGLNERHVEWVSAVRSPRVKWPGRQADHSSPSATEVGVEWTTPEHPHMLSWLGDEQFCFCVATFVD
jgi:hypothetical protein